MKCENKMSLRLRCDEDVYKDRKKCIFHLENKNDSECDKFKQDLHGYLNTSGDKDFTGFVFPYIEDLSGMHFDGLVYFNEATFLQDVHFGKTVFCNNASFDNAEFCGTANFRGVKFNGDVNFNSAKFRGDASFKSGIFNKNTYFNRTKFQNDVFLNTESKNDVNFDEAEFKNKASFSDTEFITANVDFSFAKFYGRVLFHTNKFCKKAIFSNAEFFDELYFGGRPSFGNNIVLFNKVMFNRQRITRFRSINLCNVCFFETDVSDIEFIDVTWEKNIGKILNLVQTGGITYEQVSRLYRMLRINYEKRYMFAEAGDFFVVEMEMRRLDIDAKYKMVNDNIYMKYSIIKNINSWYMKKIKDINTKHERIKNIMIWYKRNISILGLYKCLSNYGEDYHFPIILGVFLILSYPIIIYLFYGFPDNIYNSYFSFHDLGKSDLRESIKSFFQISDRYIIERLISIPILGSIFIALKRRFERR